MVSSAVALKERKSSDNYADVTLSFLMRSSIVWMSVLRSSLCCCSSSSSVCSSHIHTLFRSEFSCCHCCWFCFVRISLLRSWACRSSQRSITPNMQDVREWVSMTIKAIVQFIPLVVNICTQCKWRMNYYLMFGTLSCWDLPAQRLCPPPLSAQSPSFSLCRYCHGTHPAVASTGCMYIMLLRLFCITKSQWTHN